MRLMSSLKVMGLATAAFVCASANADVSKSIMLDRSLYDVVAPVLLDDPTAADRMVGQIYYDASAGGGFKGINVDGTVDTLSISGSEAVTSDTPNERIERIRFGGSTTSGTACSSTPCAIISQSGSWVTSVSRSAIGNYTVNVANGFFSVAPACTCATRSVSGSDIHACSIGGTGSGQTTAAIPVITQLVSNSGGTLTDSEVNIVCMGPR